MNSLSPEVERKVRQAIAAWEAASGVKLAPGEHKKVSIPLSEFTHYSELRSLLEEDTTGGFALVCCLEEMAEEIADTTVPLREFVTRPSQATRARLKLLADIRSLTDDPVVKQFRGAVGNLVAGVLNAIEVGKENQVKVARLIQQSAFGDILQKAGLWIEQSEKHQLSRGQGRGETFQLNTWVYVFTSVDLAARAVEKQPVDGLTLCLILDHPTEYSFFALGLKVGGRVFIFHEDTGLGDRDQRFRRRNPGRDLERRLQDNYFPYDSAFKFAVKPTASGSGEQYRITLGKGRDSSLTVHDDKAHRLLRVADLNPYEILWLVLLAYRLREDYWAAGKELKELSYTGSMVTLALPSGERATTALALEGSAGLDLATPSLMDVMNIRPSEYKKIGWDRQPVGHNISLLEAYADALHPDILWSDEKLLLGDGSKKDADTSMAAAGRGCDEVRGTHLEKFGETKAFEAQLTEGHLLAPRAKVVALQLHEGRKRLAKAMQAALNRDFSANRRTVAHWLQKKANTLIFVDRMRAIAATGAFLDTELVQETFGSGEHPDGKKTNVVRLQPLREMENQSVGFHVFGAANAIALYHPHFEEEKGPRRCCIQQGKNARVPSLVFVEIRPTTAAGLAELLGVSVADLPRGLRHWTRAEPYVGNSILDHLDPLDLVVNPWDSLKLQVAFYASEKALATWREALAGCQPLPACPAKVWVTSLDFAERAANPPT